MGVELGKVLAKNILSQLNQPSDVTGHDSSVRVSFHRTAELLLTKVAWCRLLVLFTTTKSTEKNESWCQNCKRLEEYWVFLTIVLVEQYCNFTRILYILDDCIVNAEGVI